MLAELIMVACGFDAVWCVEALAYDHPAFPGPFRWGARWGKPPGRLRAGWPLHWLGRPGSFYVGRWTGPDLDLICVRWCSTAAEAERHLAMPGRTVLHAALKSAWKRWRLKRKDLQAGTWRPEQWGDARRTSR